MKISSLVRSINSIAILSSWIALQTPLCLGQDHDHDSHGHDSHDHETHAEHSHDDHAADHDDHGHEHEGHTISFTDYTEQSELFVEYGELVLGEPSEFLIHATQLQDYAPVTQGSMVVRLISESGKTSEQTLTAPAREGIYIAEIIPTFSGPVTLEFEFEVGEVAVMHQVAAQVYANDDAVPAHEEEEAHSNEISFLKEQQWKIGYSLAKAGVRRVYETIPAIGSASIPNRGRFILPAPIDGIVFPSSDTEVEVGLFFEVGESVFTVKPSASWMDGISQLKQEFLTAKIELDKLEKLHDTNAASSERLRLSQIKVDTLQQSIHALGLDAENLNGSDLNVNVVASQSALLNEIYVYTGQQVKAGDALASFLDDSELIIEVKVPTSRVHQLRKISDAMIQPVGDDRTYQISALGGKLLSSRIQRSSESGMSVLRFSIPNASGEFFDGMQFQVFLMDETGSTQGVAVPKSAVLEESGIPTIYVQVEGETVEKRQVKLGTSDGKFVEILSGVSAGEYVVATGGAYVRLASLATTEMGHGHSH